MLRWQGLVVSVVILAVAGAYACAQWDPLQPIGGQTGWALGGLTLEMYKAKFKDLKVTDEQWTKIAGILNAANEAQTKWDKENADKLTAAQNLQQAAAEVYSAAIKNGDKDAIAKAQQQMADASKPLLELFSQRSALVSKANSDVHNVLTPEQKLQLTSDTIYNMCVQRYAKAELTQDQLKIIRQMCNDAAAEAQKLEATDHEAAERVYGQVMSKVNDQVLTKDQQDKASPWLKNPSTRSAQPGLQPGQSGQLQPGEQGDP